MKKIRIPSTSIIDERGISFSIISKSVLFSFILSLVLLIIFSIILTYTRFPESTIPIVVLAITILSILYASQSVARHCKSKGWLVGSIAGVSYIITLYILSLIFTQRAVYSSNMIIILFISIFFGAIGGIIGINTRKLEKRHK